MGLIAGLLCVVFFGLIVALSEFFVADVFADVACWFRFVD